ncbi:MAG: translation initiation factor IF-2 [Spirochaetota bacterium]
MTGSEKNHGEKPKTESGRVPPKIIKIKKESVEVKPEESHSNIAKKKVVVKKKKVFIVGKQEGEADSEKATPATPAPASAPQPERPAFRPAPGGTSDNRGGSTGYRGPGTGGTGGYRGPGTGGGGYRGPGTGGTGGYRGPGGGGGYRGPGGGGKIIIKKEDLAKARASAAAAGGARPARPAGSFRKKEFDKRKQGFDFKAREKAIQEQRVLDKIAQKKRQQESRLTSVPKEVEILETISVGDLAKKMNLRAADIVAKFFSMGTVVRVNDIIDKDSATILADEYGCKVKVVSVHDDATISIIADDPKDLVPRSPIVTIMGHVDHGKTSLLDKIRSTNVVAGESGGITQHIGAYKVRAKNGEIAFIDTPGHAAFTMMRARGAKVTDIVVLVVAANDGVMPQTIEAINHAKSAKVTIIVAVNKIDLPDADIEKVKRQLSEHELIAEDWGGQTLFAFVSAHTGEGIEKLLEMIILQSEVMELKANPKREAVGTVLEASLHVGRGPVGTVLVQNGTLHVGDYFIAGMHGGRVRAMFNERGEKLDVALPSTPVEVLGFEDTPEAGDSFHVLTGEQDLRTIAESRKHVRQAEAAKTVVKVTLDNLFDQIKEGQVEEFKVIIKADVQGSAEALKEALGKLSNDKLHFVAVHSGAGAISESDVRLAETSKAMIIAYRVRPENRIKSLAEKSGIEIKRFDIIYEAIEFIEAAMKGSIAKEYQDVDVGTVEVREVFKISKIGTIAGCYVTSGKIERTNGVRIMRDNVLVYKGKIASLKRFKEDVREVVQNFECGLSIENFNDIKQGDVIEAFAVQEKAQ